MADNYLEKKMADYRAARPASKSRRQPVTRLRYRPLTVLIDSLPPAATAAMTETFVTLGCTVLCTAAAEATPGCGARIYPPDMTPYGIMTDATRKGTSIDVAIAARRSPFTELAPRRIYLSAEQLSPAPAPGETSIITSSPESLALLAASLATCATDPRELHISNF